MTKKSSPHGYFKHTRGKLKGLPFGMNEAVISAHHHPRKRLIRLLRKVHYIDPRGDEWVVPRGTVFDGASIPRPFWWFCDPFHPKVLPAAALHDYFYEGKDATQWKCDWLFYHAMRCQGYHSTFASCNWVAVRGYRPVRSIAMTVGLAKPIGTLQW